MQFYGIVCVMNHPTTSKPISPRASSYNTLSDRMRQLVFGICCYLLIAVFGMSSAYADTHTGIDTGRTIYAMPASYSALEVDAEQAYRSASYLQALRLSRKILARYPAHHTALLILLKSMGRLGMVGEPAEAAVRYADMYHAQSPAINGAISQLYLASGNTEKAAYYHQLSTRQYCAFNCQQ